MIYCVCFKAQEATNTCLSLSTTYVTHDLRIKEFIGQTVTIASPSLSLFSHGFFCRYVGPSFFFPSRFLLFFPCLNLPVFIYFHNTTSLLICTCTVPNHTHHCELPTTSHTYIHAYSPLPQLTFCPCCFSAVVVFFPVIYRLFCNLCDYVVTLVIISNKKNKNKKERSLIKLRRVHHGGLSCGVLSLFLSSCRFFFLFLFPLEFLRLGIN